MSQQRANELDEFKVKADLREVAAWLGFQEDRRASDRNHTVMRDPSGRKLVVGINADTGHWCFSDNQGQHGTAIDLVQQVRGGSLGEARRHLRPFIGAPERRPEIDRTAYEPKPRPKPTKGNAMRAMAEWETANSSGRSVFLEARGLSPSTLADARFAECFRVDGCQNAVFPYQHDGALVGVERRNRSSAPGGRSFMAYTAGARPGVWCSHAQPDDSRLVIVESPIDAMSWHEMYGDEHTRYLAVRQGADPADVAAAMRDLARGAVVIAATDADAQGDRYATQVAELARAEGLEVRRHRPQREGDWNDVLRAGPQPAEPAEDDEEADAYSASLHRP